MKRRPIRLEQLMEAARGFGFDAAGAAPAVPYPRADFLDEWLRQKRHGSMEYLARTPERRKDPRQIVPNAKSVVCAAKRYRPDLPPQDESADTDADLRGTVASYAWGDDYHDVMRKPLLQLQEWIHERAGPDVESRPYIDTGPILERPAASLAGLGWIGKNTLLLNRSLGSYFFLGEIITTAEIETGAPTSDHCGSCVRCLEACPTDAFPEPYAMDASRCVSYLTIERRGPIPLELRDGVGGMVFGCDICQEVCPWNRPSNREAPDDADEYAPRDNILPHWPNPKLDDLMLLDDEGFRERFRGSPVKRTKRRGLLRNAAVALGNARDPRAVPALTVGLNDAEPLVRSHSAWALGKIGGEAAVNALKERAALETDAEVQSEIELALTSASSLR